MIGPLAVLPNEGPDVAVGRPDLRRLHVGRGLIDGFDSRLAHLLHVRGVGLTPDPGRHGGGVRVGRGDDHRSATSGESVSFELCRRRVADMSNAVRLEVTLIRAEPAGQIRDHERGCVFAVGDHEGPNLQRIVNFRRWAALIAVTRDVLRGVRVDVHACCANVEDGRLSSACVGGAGQKPRTNGCGSGDQSSVQPPAAGDFSKHQFSLSTGMGNSLARRIAA